MNRSQNNTTRQSAKTAGNPNLVEKAESYFGRAQMFLQEFFLRAGKPVDTMFEVARQRYAEGEFADAAARLRMVVKFQPENVDAWYLLGSSELANDNIVFAKIALRKVLARNPQHEEARFLLAVIEPSMPHAEQPKFAPLSLATEHFDGQALYYDQENLYDLGYAGHEEVFHSVRPFLNPQYKDFRIVDLGCGTGLAGMQFRGIAGHIEGVDISRNMMGQAEMRRDENQRRVYDKLHLMDLRRYLLDVPPASCDIILAANVFGYLGGLTPVFDGLAQALKAGGVVSFSVEPLEGNDFALVPGEGRYAHSEPYIVEQAKRVGLDVLEVKPFEMFNGAPGVQYVMRKPAAEGAAAPSLKERQVMPKAASQPWDEPQVRQGANAPQAPQQQVQPQMSAAAPQPQQPAAPQQPMQQQPAPQPQQPAPQQPQPQQTAPNMPPKPAGSYEDGNS